MPRSRSVTNARKATIAALARPPRIDAIHPLAARFVFSLRLIALHEHARRDPVPELATQLGSVDVAARALALGQAISATWPENISVGRFCCCVLTHDETTIGHLVSSAANRNRAGFEHALDGLIRPDRQARLWEAVLALVASEARAA